MRVLKPTAWLSTFCMILVTLLAGSIEIAAAGQLFVAGDSIGVGIAQAARLPSVAKGSATTSALASQLRRVPAGSTVIVSIGTNDAIAGRASANLPSRPDLNLVYVGPPCVQTKWNGTQQRFAKFLATHARHIALPCLISTRAKDGVHFTGAGYAKLWATIRDNL